MQAAAVGVMRISGPPSHSANNVVRHDPEFFLRFAGKLIVCFADCSLKLVQYVSHLWIVESYFVVDDAKDDPFSNPFSSRSVRSSCPSDACSATTLPFVSS